MTKIGEGKTPSEEPSLEKYRQEIEQGTLKFQNALETFNVTTDGGERSRLRAIMDEQLKLIDAAIVEVKRAGMYKQEEKVKNDYEAYLQDNSSENFSALEHDIQTLRDYNNL